MRAFLHGIRRAFLRPVGACLGLLFLQEEEDEAVNADLQFHCVSQEDDDADNEDLLPASDGLSGELLPKSGDKEGELQPIAKGEDDKSNPLPANGEGKGFLPPIRGVCAEEDLLPQFVGLNKSKEGDTLPINEENLYKVEFQAGHILSASQNLQFWYACEAPCSTQHSNFVNGIFATLPAWVMLIPQPRVKMKAEIMIFYMITGKLDPGIRADHADPHNRGQDGWESAIPSPHHDLPSIHFHHAPILVLSIQESYSITCSYPLLRHYPHQPSTFNLSVLMSLIKEDKAADAVVKEPAISTSMPFTPLRGRKEFQGHEWHNEVKTKTRTDESKLKTKLKMTSLLYINKDLLDPG